MASDGGFREAGQAETFGRNATNHIVAIVVTGHGHQQRFHAIDTGLTAPNPPYNLEVRWNSDVRVAHFVQWVHVPQASTPPAPPRVPRIVGSAPPSASSRSFDQRFSGLSADERRRIHAGVGTCLLYHTFLQEVFYRAWSNWGSLEISDTLGARDGLTQIGGVVNLSWTRINPTLMRSLESRLGSVLLHEMMHFRPPRSAFNGTGDSQEGEAWATQVFFSDYVGDEEESLRLTNMMQNDFGGEVEHPPAARIHSDLVYLAWSFVMDAVDTAAGRHRAIFTQQENAASRNPGSFAQQLMTNLHWCQHPEGAPVFQYLRDQTTRSSRFSQLRQNPVGVLAIYPTRRLMGSIS